MLNKPNRPQRRVIVHPADVYAGAPGLKAARARQGVSLESLSELTGYPAGYLRRMEDEGQTAPRIVTSRLAAVLGVEHTVIRSEGPSEVTRLRDVQVPGESNKVRTQEGTA